MARNTNRNRALLPVKLASYGKAKVYKSKHIKLNANLLNTLDIRPGDLFEVFLNTEDGTIVLKSPNKDNWK